MIPTDLTRLRRWVVWRSEQRNGKPTKVPYTPKTGRRASVSDPRTWVSFAQATAAASKYDGIGYVLTQGDGIVGFDLDDCRDPHTGTITPEAQAIIDEIRSYTEKSPSGTGIRIIAKGALPALGRKQGWVEVYDDRRFVTITGEHIPGTPSTIEERSEAITGLHQRVFGDGDPGPPGGDGLPPRWVRLVETNPRVRAVWEGEERGCTDESGSVKDMRLAHEIRRRGFTPQEAPRILVRAPYPVGGGRSAAYLSKTVAKAFAAGRRPLAAPYGILPASLIDSGVFAKLPLAAKALLTVLCVRRLRPSGTVRRSAEHLAEDAGISVRTIPAAAAALEEAGLVKRHRVAGGRMLWTVLLPTVQPWVRNASDATNTTAEEEQPAVQRITPGHGPAAAARVPLPRNGPGHRMNFGGLDSGPGPGSLLPLMTNDPITHGSTVGDGKSLTHGLTVGDKAVLPSMRLDQEFDGRGRKRVYRICSDGHRVLVWQGDISDWLSCTPPEVLRDESRIAEWPHPEARPS